MLVVNPMTVVNEWLALRRVHEGAVAAVEGRFFNHGRPVADYLAAALDELIRSEYLALSPADPAGMQPVGGAMEDHRRGHHRLASGGP